MANVFFWEYVEGGVTGAWSYILKGRFSVSVTEGNMLEGISTWSSLEYVS